MARRFSEIAFTPKVLAHQERLGSAPKYAEFLSDQADPADRIGPDEASFIRARDGFYQATISETGWPYVQFRGGPPGFLRVLDDTTIGYADFRGNRQYISLGNLTGDDRVSLILMDYPSRRRLKLFGHARLVETEEDPFLTEKLMVPGYRARPERAVVISVTALDWNCPQHIPMRLTLEELEASLAPVRADLARLKAENERLRAELAAAGQGSGGTE
ncbi:MAG: pyridoxamine 5'-phosphate oxidase family protein [Pseudomonadota bacterium]